MAGDWFKVERSTLRKPEILLAAELLGMVRREALGLFLDYFAWLDENMQDSRNGFVTLVSRKSLEEALQCAGFAAVLERIGWAKFDDEALTLQVMNHDRHNGTSAKSRALSKDRQSRFRNDPVTHSTLPEKRRDITPIVPTRFAQFWDLWPAGQRKVDRAKCEKKWRAEKLDLLADRIFAHIEAMRGTAQWRRNPNGESFEPAPMTYLNGKRWEDGVPLAAVEKKQVQI